MNRSGGPHHENYRRRSLVDAHSVRHGRQARDHGRPQLADHEHGLAAHRHRPGAGGLGRSLRPRLGGNHDGGAGHATGPRRPRRGRGDIARAPVEGVPRLRPQRRARVALRRRSTSAGTSPRRLLAWRLLGASPVTRLVSYASLLRYGEASMVAATCERAVARGYRDIKLHEITVPEVRAARQAIGPRPG